MNMTRVQKMNRRILGLSLLVAFLGGQTLVAASKSRENQIMASYLYNFLKFVTWPDSAFSNAGDDLVLVILGEDVFGPVLSKIAGKTIEGRKLAVRKITDVKDLEPCHLLFISPSESAKIDEIMAAARQKSILTVSSIDDFMESGGVIGFHKKNNRLKYRINLASAKVSQLKISSRVLKSAVLYKG